MMNPLTKLKEKPTDSKLLTEEIHADEARNEISAVKTVINGKRNIGFVNLNKEYADKLEKKNIKVIPVRMTSQNTIQSIIYREDAKHDAFRLYDIAKSRNGFLRDRTPEEAREIGKILGYTDASIEEYVRKHYYKGPSENPDDYHDLYESVELPKLNKRVLYHEFDCDIYVVNGEMVRDGGFIEWVDGGHYYVDADLPKAEWKYAKYIPEDEIWIDDVFAAKPNDMMAIILHEMVERYLMKYHDLSYNIAHSNYANPLELGFRKKSKGGLDEKLAREIYETFIANYEKKRKKKNINENYQYQRIKNLFKKI